MSDSNEVDLIMAPIAVNIAGESVVVGHVYLQRKMAELYQLWDLTACISDVGLTFLATPKIMTDYTSGGVDPNS